jgi:hypothetical protein
MCYETYERLLWARGARRRANKSETPDREASKPEARKASAEPATPEPVKTREKEPA